MNPSLPTFSDRQANDIDFVGPSFHPTPQNHDLPYDSTFNEQLLSQQLRDDMLLNSPPLQLDSNLDQTMGPILNNGPPHLSSLPQSLFSGSKDDVTPALTEPSNLTPATAEAMRIQLAQQQKMIQQQLHQIHQYQLLQQHLQQQQPQQHEQYSVPLTSEPHLFKHNSLQPKYSAPSATYPPQDSAPSPTSESSPENHIDSPAENKEAVQIRGPR